MGPLDDLGTDYHSAGDTPKNTRTFLAFLIHILPFRLCFTYFWALGFLVLTFCLGLHTAWTSYSVIRLGHNFLMVVVTSTLLGVGWKPCRGKTPHSWLHLQLPHLLPWPLVHCAEDQAMSGLFLHGLSTDAYTNLTLLRLFFKVHLLHLLVCLWWNTALPATLTWSVILRCQLIKQIIFRH